MKNNLIYIIVLMIYNVGCAETSKQPKVTQTDQVNHQYTDGGFSILNAVPVWALNSNLGNRIGGVGIIAVATAKTISKRIDLATKIAENRIVEQISLLMTGLCESTEIKKFDTKLIELYRNRIDCKALQTAQSWLDNSQVMDQWINPKNGDVYVWIILN